MQKTIRISLRLFIIAMAGLLLSGCVSVSAHHVNNVCAIFSQNPSWYRDANRSQRRWGVPSSTLMAIMWQESRFRPDVKPPRERILGIIPWTRPTSANGYSQATYESWWQYQDYTDNFSARRSNFKDAIDFVGWYSYLSHKKLGIPLNDTYALYLAYHEGWGGYAARTYRHKRWLRKVAWRVNLQAKRYHDQLVHCWRSLEGHSWF